MEIKLPRPPFVEFKRVAVHDKKRSLEMGRRITKDVDYAFIMQPGSRDQVERVAEEWFASLKLKIATGDANAYPPEVVDMFRKKYDAWKQGHEAPLNGTSIKEWAVLSPAEAENFISLHILTIEDAAMMTEEAMRAYGMGARELRDKAKEWLKGNNSAQAENELLKKQLAELTERLLKIENLSDNSEKSQQIKRGRKPKEIDSVE